ncbi:MAG: type III pantothenate kinase [Oscillospiraceae bacterium]
MIFTADIGNTNIVLGGFEAGILRLVLRLPSDRQRGAAAYVRDFRHLLSAEKISPENAEGCIISSVVPELQSVLSAALWELTGKIPLLVDANMDSGLVIRHYDASQLGNDRIADAVAALAQYKPPIAIFDMGTATTLSVLDCEGCLIGGMIMPGLRLALEALSSRAAQLPPIELAAPKQLLGTDAISCMQSGAIYGTAAMLDGLTTQVETELGKSVAMVVTGGLSTCVIPYCHHMVHHEENLLLHGLHLLFRRNSKNRSD